jgi:cytidylate kinase
VIVTVDGPAGAGKSTAARSLAKRLSFLFLDTGAMYRAVALAAVRRTLAWDDPAALAELAGRLSIQLHSERVILDAEDVTDEIRTVAITTVTHYAADNPGVREKLVRMQRAAAGHDSIVTEGRDQGTVVFPDAECKIFLTASAAERARRRQADLAARGEIRSFEEVLDMQNLRDERDSNRLVGPLRPAADATHVITDGLTALAVVDHLEAIVRSKMR